MNQDVDIRGAVTFASDPMICAPATIHAHDSSITIGRNFKADSFLTVVTECQTESGVPTTKPVTIGDDVTVGRGVFIYGGAQVGHGVSIGNSIAIRESTVPDGTTVKVDPVGYRSFWHQLYIDRIDESPEVASGRGSYDADDVKAAVNDAVAALELHDSDSLLDVGCGKGLLGGHLRKLAASYVGLDFVAGLGPTVVGDAVSLPFRDETFDKILFAGVLCCIPPVWNAAAITDLRRVTKPGGRAFISCNPFRYIHQMASIYRRDELMDLALRCGWNRAWITPIHRRLPQSQQFFDMVVSRD